MRLSEFCLKRPVITIVMNAFLVVIGLVGYLRLEIRDLPKMTVPSVTVNTSYPGASASSVELQVTKKLEDVLSGIEGVEHINSESRKETSQIVLNFNYGYDLNEGANVVRDRVSRAIRYLPENVSTPVVEKIDINSNPTLYISFSDNNRSPMALTKYITDYIKPDLEQLSGVGAVAIWGARDYTVQVSPKSFELAARNLTVIDIEKILASQNFYVAGGNIESKLRTYQVVPLANLENISDIKNLRITKSKGDFIKLEEVADIEIVPNNEDVIVKSNGKQAIIVAVTPQSTANPVTISRLVNKYLYSISNNLPGDMHFNIQYDRSVAIDASINNVYEAIFEAIALVMIVIFVFLGNIRAALVPIITIPVCLIGVFSILYFFGYSLNNITLLALVLAIGLVVDDAIVVLENIYRHIEKGDAVRQAAIKGSKEIGFAIIAMTGTLAAVYTPAAFIENILGSVFREFATTLAGAVIISGFVALTLSPMMCARMLSPKDGRSRYLIVLDNLFARLQQFYQAILVKALRYKKIVLATVLILSVFGSYIFMKLPAELAPTEDSGVVMTIIIAPEASNKDALAEPINYITEEFSKLIEGKSYLTINGIPRSNQGMAFLILKPWDKRSLSQQDIADKLSANFSNFPSARIFSFSQSPFPFAGSGSDSVELILQTNGSYELLATQMQTLIDAVAKNDKLKDIRSDLELNNPVYELLINKNAVADLGVNLNDIMTSLNLLMAGKEVAKLEIDSKEYPIEVKLKEALRKNIQEFSSWYVQNPQGKMISLDALVDIRKGVSVSSLQHYGRMRSATLTARLSPNYSQSEAIAYIENIARQVLNDNVKFTWGEAVKEYLKSNSTMLNTIILSLLFIYFILAAQFESFRDPLIIILTVPFSIIGAVITLALFSGSNNIYTQVGFITLIGLITKHGILLTEFANRLREQGHDLEQAIINSAITRLRPILMTTLAMVLGALPLAFATGAGSASRMQIGLTIVGGLSIGTVFSLIVIPVVYLLIAKKNAH